MGNPDEPRCKVCRHPDRAAIEQAILNGRPHRDVARTFGLTYGKDHQPDHKIVGRHIDNHMAALYQKAMGDRLDEAGNALVQRMALLDTVVDETLARLREGKPVEDENGPTLDADGKPVRRYDERTLLAAVREARRNVDMHARLAGIMPEGDENAAATARAALMDPKARRAIADLEAMLADVAGEG